MSPRVFTSFVETVRLEIYQNELWNLQGASAVFCFIEKATGRFYTSGWGNNELYLCRQTADAVKIIPAFCGKEAVNKVKSSDTFLLLSKGCASSFSPEEV